MRRSFVFGMCIGAAVMAVALAAYSEISTSMDPVKVSPEYYKVLFENEQVRVLEYHLKAGEKEKAHSHSAGIVYSFGEGKLRSTFPDGKSSEATAKAGEVHWRDPITHSLENIGSTELHALAVELKKTCN